MYVRAGRPAFARPRNGEKNNCMDTLNDKLVRLHTKNLDMAKKRNLKRESESLLIVAQDNAIRMSYIQAKIDNTRKNSKCRLCGD